MAGSLYAKYNSYTLNELITMLDNRYYQPLEVLGVNAGKYADELLEGEEQTWGLFAASCNTILQNIKKHIFYRRGRLVTYVYQLAEKQQSGHDCSACSGKCSIGHSTNLESLTLSHKEVGKVLLDINQFVYQTAGDQNFSPVFRVLRNELGAIDTLLTEMYYLEEICLVPALVNAKNSINA